MALEDTSDTARAVSCWKSDVSRGAGNGVHVGHAAAATFISRDERPVVERNPLPL